MSDDLNPAIIKQTQDILGKYVKKPNLTDKLLKKPPFRFLHDVFSVIIRDTKCFVGLYTLEELTYENINDRDDKMKFLQKIIDVVKITTGSTLVIKTSKIVAGHEPEKTNELLQLIGKIIENKLDWQTAVELVLSGKTPHKESQRKSRESENKLTKETKPKENKHNEKSKEKVSKTMESKKSKASAGKMATSTKKDDKTKTSKAKDNTLRQVLTKEKILKGNKEAEKSVKKLGNESSNIKPKLKKSESHSSNKSSPSPKAQESMKELKSLDNETECNHKEEIEQQKENSKMFTSPQKLSNHNFNNAILKSNEFAIENQMNSPSHLSHLETDSLSTEKSRKSAAKTRKSSSIKSPEDFAEHVDDKEKEINLEMAKSRMSSQEKSEIFGAGTIAALKQNSTTNHDQQPSQNNSESDNLNKKLQEPPSSSGSQKLTGKPRKTSSPVTLNNEMKRESTFTRENSIESNRSSLANRPRTSLRPPSARPPSARPGAPRRRDKNIEIILQPNDQIKMSGIQVKLETFGDLDDDENLVIIENPNANDVTIDHSSNLTESEKIMQDEILEQGHLVQQILETQKELVQQQNDASTQKKNDKDSVNNSVMRQTSARNMNNLRDIIQNITKSVNPLGKLMDFIPEDIDAMQLEFTLWRDAYIQAANELKREKSLTESATEPMKNQLIQIEENIVEYMEIINASRVKILQNSEKIIKMLTT